MAIAYMLYDCVRMLQEFKFVVRPKSWPICGFTTTRHFYNDRSLF